MNAPLSAAGTQASAVGFILSQPLKGFDVLAIQYDLTCLLSPGRETTTGITDLYDKSIQIGHALYSDRTAADGVTPVTVPAYDNSQWPVFQGATSSTRDDNEYPIRTYHSWASMLATEQVNQGAAIGGANAINVRSHRVRRKLAQRFTDTTGLFFNFWNNTLVTTTLPVGSTVEWFVTGSLWYRMVW